ncbi:hypothetical protein [Actinoplanes friuliensis]|uniref:hypothetical protein n=1 Tax=Actinoplanes friuliensis TaxID=196914 RepID=UPI0011DE2A47|nr:hypothetical protein [Actinoplanes friuliensis]
MSRWLIGVLVIVGLALGGCAQTAAEQYQEREKFLDTVTNDGITYRGQLQKQGSQISEQGCLLGYDLRDYGEGEIPSAPDDSGLSSEKRKTWLGQVKESYVKGCLTGLPRPKPEPSGVKAVTPVPHGSVSSGR